jgi:hypothetical protein
MSTLLTVAYMVAVTVLLFALSFFALPLLSGGR